ncbi:MAG: HEAT repeat domain-containing protein [Deltaproteobacteria bacterium]|nr:HEAT repeat domain-containing protein [Deltaproteobacteria bacterium]
MRLLGRGASGRSLAAALRDLADPEPIVRAGAATDLARYAVRHRDQVVAPLVKTLCDEYPKVRAAAALTLGDCGDAETVEPLLERLADEEEEARVRLGLLTALGEIGDARATEGVAAALTDDAPAVRFQAVIAFARVCADHDEAIATLLEASHDDDPLVCHIAMRVAEEVGIGDDRSEDGAVAPQILARAVELLDHDSDVVRIVAAIIAGRAGRPDGRDILLAAAIGELCTSEADDEFAAIELCGQLGIEEAIPYLELRAFAGLLNRDRFAWPARVALAALGNARAITWLLKELEAWTFARRTVAVAAAGRARLAQARPLLEAMRNKPSRAEPDAVEKALAALATQSEGAVGD